jgi:hypothetical protein
VPLPAQQSAPAGTGAANDRTVRQQSACQSRGMSPLLVRARASFGVTAPVGARACQVGTPEYDRQLRRALEEAEAVLVLNPLIGALVGPYAPNVRVAPWGMDPSRFPWPLDDDVAAARPAVRLEGGVVDVPSFLKIGSGKRNRADTAVSLFPTDTALIMSDHQRTIRRIASCVRGTRDVDPNH